MEYLPFIVFTLILMFVFRDNVRAALFFFDQVGVSTQIVDTEISVVEVRNHEKYLRFEIFGINHSHQVQLTKEHDLLDGDKISVTAKKGWSGKIYILRIEKIKA